MTHTVVHDLNKKSPLQWKYWKSKETYKLNFYLELYQT